MNESNTDYAPVVKQVTVPWPIADAFRRFTHEIGSWWPRATHSVFKDRAKTCTLEVKRGGRLYETSDSGEKSVWGTVLAVEEPKSVRFTWHPGREPDTAQEVEVRFESDGTGTRVTLTHTGWDKLGDRAGAVRADYDKGWESVLAYFTMERAS